MKGRLTITVEMDDAGACQFLMEMAGRMLPFDHGRLFAVLGSQAGHSARQAVAAYAAAGHQDWAFAFAAGCISDPGATTIRQTASGIREPPGRR